MCLGSHRGVVRHLRLRLGRLLRLVRLCRNRHVCYVLRSHRSHRLQADGWLLRTCSIRLLFLRSSSCRLALKFASLELLETLHYCAVWQTFLVLDSRDTAVLCRVDIVPACTSSVLILSRVECQAHETSIFAIMLLAGGVWIRLDYSSGRWNEIQISTLQFFGEGLHLTLSFVERVSTCACFGSTTSVVLIDQLSVLIFADIVV